jgi:hypothetical protein
MRMIRKWFYLLLFIACGQSFAQQQCQVYSIENQQEKIGWHGTFEQACRALVTYLNQNEAARAPYQLCNVIEPSPQGGWHERIIRGRSYVNFDRVSYDIPSYPVCEYLVTVVGENGFCPAAGGIGVGHFNGRVQSCSTSISLTGPNTTHYLLAGPDLPRRE